MGKAKYVSGDKRGKASEPKKLSRKSIIMLIAAALLIVAAILIAVLVTKGNSGAPAGDVASAGSDQNPIVTMEVEGFGTVEMELYPDMAPNTVANFVNLVEEGFYDGLTFHRIIDGLLLQGGDPNGDGTGGPGYSIKGEFSQNGYSDNTLSHTRGTLSMARSMSADSAGSQFFIVVSDYPSWDGSYAAFGRVIDGMDIVDEISKVETDSSDKPVENVVIKSMTVDTKGIEYTVDKIEE